MPLLKQNIKERHNKNPLSDQEEIITILTKTMVNVKINYSLKRLSLTNSFDCTKDVAVSDRLMEAVGKSLLGKQKQIMKHPILKPIQRLTKTTAPLKDVHLIILKKVNHFHAKVKRC